MKTGRIEGFGRKAFIVGVSFLSGIQVSNMVTSSVVNKASRALRSDIINLAPTNKVVEKLVQNLDEDLGKPSFFDLPLKAITRHERWQKARDIAVEAFSKKKNSQETIIIKNGKVSQSKTYDAIDDFSQTP